MADSWWDTIWGSLPGVGPITEAEKKLLGGAMPDIGDTISFSKAVWLNISDFRMWRSLGWLVLGILLMIIGFVVWNRKALAAATTRLPI